MRSGLRVGDHDTLYPDSAAARNKLKTYGEWFRTVEVDSSFYAVQPVRNMEKWTAETAAGFHFIVKAYQGMTGHARGGIPFETVPAMFDAFRASLEPMVAADNAKRMMALLGQVPPRGTFDTGESAEQLDLFGDPGEW